jgi:Protein of unknown function (DUF3575)
MRTIHSYNVLLLMLAVTCCFGQSNKNDTANRQYKNVVRYNISGALLCGIDKYIVMGYERVINPRQSFSINFGAAALPKITNINTDSFNVDKDLKRSGFNVSVDYRFYLAKENKHATPHGVYIGPYYSFNQFKRDNQWNFKNSSTQSHTVTKSDLKIHTVGFELGYQFIFWKRMTLDLVMIGPGLGFYRYKANFDSNLNPAAKEQLLDGLQQLLTQKFPGMNFVLNDEELDGNGVLKKNALGYRYLVHIGFAF